MALQGVADATRLLACREDLGMVPPQVPEVMHELGVLSLEIERMPKDVEHWRTDPAMLCVLPLQDWLAMDADLRRDDPDAEQINQPADRHHRWRYRLHLTTTDLHAAEAFTERVRERVAASGRVR